MFKKRHSAERSSLWINPFVVLSLSVVCVYVFVGVIAIVSMFRSLIDQHTWGLSLSVVWSLGLTILAFTLAVLVALTFLYAKPVYSSERGAIFYGLSFLKECPPLIHGFLIGFLFASWSLPLALFVLIMSYSVPRIYLFFVNLVENTSELQADAALSMNMNRKKVFWFRTQEIGVATILGTILYSFFEVFTLTTPVLGIFAFANGDSLPWFPQEMLQLMFSGAPEVTQWGAALLFIYIVLLILIPRPKFMERESYG